LLRNPNIAAVAAEGERRMPLPTPASVDARIQQRETDYQARRGPDAGFDWARMGGQVAATLPLAMAMPAGSGLIGAAGAGAMQGAVLAGLEPVTSGDFGDEKKAQMEAGGMLGAVMGPAGRLIGRAISPRVSDDVQALAAEGVQMTPGQMVGGMARRVEDATTSLPWVGDSVLAARRAGVESFNRAAGNRVLREFGEELPPTVEAGRPMAEFLSGRVSQAYNDAVGAVQPFRPDGRFLADMQGVSQQFLTPNSRQEFARELQDRIVSRFQRGDLDGPTYQTIKSDLGGLAQSARAQGTPAGRELAAAYDGVRDALRELLERNSPDAAAALSRADAAYSALLRVRGAQAGPGRPAAGGGAGNCWVRMIGRFTPSW
jgi:hypothetical protein